MKGIDISSNNANLNFAKARAAGFEVVLIKATEGLTYTSPALRDQYNSAKANGFKIGFYHYLRDNDPIAEAKHFLSAIQGLQSDCKYMIDSETLFNGVSSNTRKFADYLISQNKEPLLYTGADFYTHNLDASIKDLPLLVACYSSTRPNIKSIGWQFTEKGNIGGVVVDMDTFEDGILLTSTKAVPTQLAVKLVTKSTTIIINSEELFNQMFSEKFYLSKYPDVATKVPSMFATGKAHYLAYGQKENRDPCPPLPQDFSEAVYLANSPDVAKAVVNKSFSCGAEHYLMYGFAENRKYK